MYHFDDLIADPNRLEIKRNGENITLEPKALKVLFHLLRNRDRLVGKEELIAQVWDGAFVTDNAITRVIAQIRKQLGDSAKAPKYIETSQTSGYRFIAAVREVSGDVLVAAAPAEAKRCSTRKWVALSAVPGLFVLIAVGWWIWNGADGQPVRLHEMRQISSSSSADLWPSFSPDASQIAYSSSRSGSFELYIRSRAPGSAERQVTTDRQENIQPVWSPDGQYLAYVSRRRGGIGLIPVSGGATRYLTDFGDSPAWSPDGRLLAFRRFSMNLNPAIETSGLADTTLWLVGTDGSAPRPLTQPGAPPGGHGAPRWSADGRSILFATNTLFATTTVPSSKLWVVDVTSGVMTPLESGVESVRSPVLSPDGKHLFFVSTGGRDPGLWHAPVRGKWRLGMPELLIPAGGTAPRDLTISADGKRLAFSQQTGESALWTVPLKLDGSAAGEPKPFIRDRSVRNAEPTFSADGSMLAYASVRQGGEMSIYTARPDGSAVAALTTADQNSARPSWLGNLLTVGYRASVKDGWEYWLRPLAGAPRRLELRLDLSKADRMRISRDGRKMAAHVTTAGGFQVVVEDLVTHVVRKLTPEGRNIGFPTWSPDGKWIAAQERVAGNTTLVYFPADGGAIERLAGTPTQSFNSDWSTDSDKVLVAGLHEGLWDIYWVSRTTGRVEQLTHFASQSAFVRYPAWSPKNDQVVFEHNNLTANIYVAEIR